jgi:hypothetical protein
MSNVVAFKGNPNPRRTRPYAAKVVDLNAQKKDWEKVYTLTNAKTIRDVVEQLVRQGLDNATIAGFVRTIYPRSKIKPNTVNWYKTKMREKGEDV